MKVVDFKKPEKKKVSVALAEIGEMVKGFEDEAADAGEELVADCVVLVQLLDTAPVLFASVDAANVAVLLGQAKLSAEEAAWVEKFTTYQTEEEDYDGPVH